MRLMTWNCRIGGFRRKAGRVAPFRPDILAVQEVERLDGDVPLDGELQPTFRDRVADPAYPKRAVGVFSYTGAALEAVDLADPMYCFRRYEAELAGLHFNVCAVWTAPTKPRSASYRQAHEGLRVHADWVQRRPTVVLGDFNHDASYGDGKSWRELAGLLEPLGLVSAYHEYFGEAFGREKRKTHFHHGKEGAGFHLDYCFIPKAWASSLRAVQVGTYANWHDVSDHAPVIVDLDLGAAA